MFCGIDLGTTNSLIGHGDELFTGLVSSSVDVDTKSQVARDAFGDNIVSSYKTNMTIGDDGQLPIACSSVILKHLCEKASKRTGQEIKDVVVSVPAKFTHTQRQAVWKAAEMAGLNIKGLINEPTAAALYVCKDLKDLVVVYDLGGGTFDVTIIDSRCGNYYVVDTNGRILAGDDFDEALAELAYEELKIKVRFRSGELAKKFLKEIRTAKEILQVEGLTQYLDMSDYGYNGEWELTVDKYIETMKKVFQVTIDLTKSMIATSLDSNEKPSLVFVGGSTACPYLKKWVTQEVGLEVLDYDIKPDYVVARGVALYAKMLEEGTAQKEVDDVTKRLCIEDELGRSITVIEKNTTIPVSQFISVHNTIDCDKLELNLYQGDSILCSENDYIGTLIYDYGQMVKAEEGFVQVTVTVDRDGRVSLIGEDILTGMKQDVKLVVR